MTWYEPPEECPGTPAVRELPVGTRLHRVHTTAFAGSAFNPTDPDAPDAAGGGRFDSPGGRPPFLYAADSERAALAEGLLRDVPFDDLGYRLLPRRQLLGRSLSCLVVRASLAVVSLHGPAMAQLGQDLWLVNALCDEYPRTRAWAARIRGWAPGAAGLEWRSRQDDDDLSYVLYADAAEGSLEVESALDLEAGEGLERARRALVGYNVGIDL